MFDIDIDFSDRDKALQTIHHVPAMITNKNGQTLKHVSGIYFQDIPVNPLNKLCSFDYKHAEKLGYFKVDFLNQSVYNQIRDEDHLNRLMNTDPPWELLSEKNLVSQLIHIHSHFDVVDIIKPKSVEDLAVVLALIRPAKRNLLYKNRKTIDEKIWLNDDFDDAYQFKRAHAISYAALIVIQFNLIIEQLENDYDGISI